MNTKKESLLESLVNSDGAYQELLRQCMDLEPEYLRIRNSLSGQDQELLDRYISLCEEMDHCRLMLALTIHLQPNSFLRM